MPFYEYIHKDGKCPKGKNKFQILQSMTAEPLEVCPKCSQKVLRVISVPGKPVRNILSTSNLAEKGFTQFTKKEKGVYERTAGSGPDFIVDKKDKLD